MDDLVRWLGEQLDEDERIAKAAAEEYGAVWTADDRMEGVSSDTGADVVAEPLVPYSFIAEHDPARVLREIAAKRQLVRAYEEAVAAFNDSGPAFASYDRLTGSVSSLRRAVELAALSYADRPGYRQEWRP